MTSGGEISPRGLIGTPKNSIAQQVPDGDRQDHEFWDILQANLINL